MFLYVSTLNKYINQSISLVSLSLSGLSLSLSLSLSLVSLSLSLSLSLWSLVSADGRAPASEKKYILHAELWKE